METSHSVLRLVALALSFIPCGIVLSQTNYWEPTGGPNYLVQAIAISPTGYIYAGSGIDRGGVLRSTDNGSSWQKTSVSGGWNVNAIHSNSIGHIFAAVNYYDNTQVYRSTDEGLTWTQVSNGLMNHTVICLQSNTLGHLFAGTYYYGTTSGGIFRSTDEGNTWTLIALANLAVRSIAINTVGEIFAGTDSGAYRMTDTGASCTRIISTNTPIRALAINSSGHIFAGSDSLLLRSSDNGIHWDKVNLGLTAPRVRVIVINSLNHLFLATFGHGVLHSIDNGNSWVNVNSGLPSLYINALIRNTADYLFAGGGVGVSRTVRSTTQRSPDIEFALNSIQITNISPEWPLRDATLFPSTDTSYISVLLKNNQNASLPNLPVSLYVNGSQAATNTITLQPLSLQSLVVFPLHIPSRSTENLAIEIRIDPARTTSYRIAKDRLQDTVSFYFVTSTDGKTPFNLRRDAYHFRNYPFEPSDFISGWVKTISNPPTPWQLHEQIKLGLSYGLFALFSGIGGHCYGIAATSSLYLSNSELKPFPSLSTWDLTLPQASSNISIYQASQCFQVLDAFSKLLPPPPSMMFDQTKSAIKNNIAPILALKRDVFGGHAVTAYKIVERSKMKIVYIYDNNFPASLTEKQTGAFAIVYDFRTPDATIDVYNAEYPSFSYYPRLHYFSNYGDNNFNTLSGVLLPHLSVYDSDRQLLNNAYTRFLTLWKNNIAAMVACPTYPLITDQSGRKIGIVQGKVVNEIPGANIDTALGVKLFRLPRANAYSFTSTAYDSGTMAVNFISPHTDSTVKHVQFQHISISKNSISRATLSESIGVQSLIYNTNFPGSRDSVISPTTVNVVNVVTAVLDDRREPMPMEFALYSNYPNPFNPSTMIEFALHRSSYATLKVFGILGQEVATLLSEYLSPGRYKVQWNASGAASGVYLYRLQVGGLIETKKLIVLR